MVGRHEPFHGFRNDRPATCGDLADRAADRRAHGDTRRKVPQVQRVRAVATVHETGVGDQQVVTVPPREGVDAPRPGERVVAAAPLQVVGPSVPGEVVGGRRTDHDFDTACAHGQAGAGEAGRQAADDGTAGAFEAQGVVTGSARDGVVAAAHAQQVVAFAAVQHVVAGSAHERVVAAHAKQLHALVAEHVHIVGEGGEFPDLDVVRPEVRERIQFAEDQVGTAAHGADRADPGGMCGGQGHGVPALTAIERVVPEASHEDVIAGAAIEAVVAGEDIQAAVAAVQGVVALEALDRVVVLRTEEEVAFRGAGDGGHASRFRGGTRAIFKPSPKKARNPAPSARKNFTRPRLPAAPPRQPRRPGLPAGRESIATARRSGWRRWCRSRLPPCPCRRIPSAPRPAS
ncbi:MAG: hypothetical protein K0S57_2887 [Ramlibacter sp.]|nr:hypothetical protein [Ramlibacter sp.]